MDQVSIFFCLEKRKRWCFHFKKIFARGTGKSPSSLGVRLEVRDPDGLIGGGQRGLGKKVVLSWIRIG